MEESRPISRYEFIRRESEQIVEPLLKTLHCIGIERRAVCKLQLAVLEEVLTTQYVLKSLKLIKEFMKDSLKEGGELKGDLDSGFPYSLLQKQILETDQKEEAYRLRIKALKSIIDSIVWKCLPRHVIKRAIGTRKPDTLIGKKGLFLELACWEGLVESTEPQGIPVLNDITSCLGIGDVSLIEDRMLLPFECKIGRVYDGKRAERQTGKRQDLYRYLRDARKAIKEDRPVRLDWVDIDKQGPLDPGNHSEDSGKPYLSFVDRDEEKTNWEEAKSVISLAGVEGKASRVVEDCCLYVVFSQREKSTMDIAEYRRLSTLLRKVTKDPTPDRLTRVKDSWPLSREADEWLSEVMGDFLEDPGELRAVRLWDVDLATRDPTFLPIPLFEIDRDMVLDLLVDRIVFLVFLRLDRLCASLEKLGFEIVARREGHETLVTIWKEGHEFPLHRSHLMERIGLEFLSVNSFCEMVEKCFQSMEGENRATFPL